MVLSKYSSRGAGWVPLKVYKVQSELFLCTFGLFRVLKFFDAIELFELYFAKVHIFVGNLTSRAKLHMRKSVNYSRLSEYGGFTIYKFDLSVRKKMSNFARKYLVIY